MASTGWVTPGWEAALHREGAGEAKMAKGKQEACSSPGTGPQGVGGGLQLAELTCMVAAGSQSWGMRRRGKALDSGSAGELTFWSKVTQGQARAEAGTTFPRKCRNPLWAGGCPHPRISLS